MQQKSVRSSSESYFWPTVWAVTIHVLLFAMLFVSFHFAPELPPARQALVQKAVRYHNGREIPPDDAETVFFARMIRDADKLDILEMITSESTERHSWVEPGPSPSL